MVMFHSCVSLPEGNWTSFLKETRFCWLNHDQLMNHELILSFTAWWIMVDPLGKFTEVETTSRVVLTCARFMRVCESKVAYKKRNFEIHTSPKKRTWMLSGRIVASVITVQCLNEPKLRGTFTILTLLVWPVFFVSIIFPQFQELIRVNPGWALFWGCIKCVAILRKSKRLYLSIYLPTYLSIYLSIYLL